LNIHMVRTVAYEQAWAAGVIVPRWTPNMAYGYGYPLFVFAPPLPYLLAMALHSLGITLEAAFKLLLSLIILTYALGMYLLARDLFHSREAGLIAATAYVLAPFVLREMLLYGGNVPQFLAIALFPWSLWSAVRAGATRSPVWIIIAAIFYAGIVLSHLFQALIFTPVLGAFGLLLITLNRLSAPANQRHRLREWSPLLIIPVGLLLSTFFWLPVLFERHFTRAETGAFLDKSPFFVRYPHWTELVAWLQPLDFRAANPYVPLTLGVVTLILASLGLLTIGYFWRSAISRQRSAFILFFAGVAGGAIFMTLPVSQPVWEAAGPLQVAEFPWRMLGLANLGLAILAGAAVLLVPIRGRVWAMAICLLVQLWAVAPLLYPVIPFVQRGEWTIADQITYERSSQSIGTTTLGEYLPKTVERPPSTSPLVPEFEANRDPERLDRTSLPPQAVATLLEQTAVTHRYQIDTPTAFTLRLYHFDYPGWRARLDDQPVAITPEAETGLMLINIPAGQHTLTVHFGETPLRLTALLLSGIALVAAAIITIKPLAMSDQGAAVSHQPSAVSGQPSSFIIHHSSFIIVLAVIVFVALVIKPILQPWFTQHSPPGQVLPAQHQADIRFANGIRLTGYDLSRQVIPAGDYLQVVLYWETDRGPYRDNLQPFVHLDRLDDFTTVAEATNYTPGDVTTEMNMPTFHWDNARYVRDEHDLYLPPETPPLAYAVRIGLINIDDEDRLIPLADGSGDTALIDTINVSPSQKSPADLAHPVNIAFDAPNGDTIQLLGYEMGEITSDQARFDLLWQSRQRPQADYTIFAQLLDANRQLITSFDRPPLDGAYPTSTWLPGQMILDERFVPLTTVPAGRYTLIIGLYDASNGQRLTTPEGSDFVELSDVTVKK
ncbi:MAG: glycosyltransferase family 39 protein, partial [Anaerolineae bacterium]|nr:glycosyltransferase family 39 protein [Anaerolineae bacterium]